MNRILTCTLLALLPFAACLSQKHDLTRMVRNGEAILIDNQQFDKEVNFTDMGLQPVYTGDNEYRVYISSPIVFRHCTFKQVVRASGIGSANVFATFTRPVVFEDCRFYGACNFRNAVLLDKLSFVKCLFDSALNLQSTDCAGAVNLDNTACSGAVQAQDATFRKKVSAINATFLTSVSFQGSTFFGPANFSNSTFEQYVDFGLARFMGHVFYNYVSFRSNAVFNQCRFMGRAEWLTVNSNNMQVQQALFSEPPRFTNSKFTGRLDLSESKYLSGKPDLTGITGTVTGN